MRKILIKSLVVTMLFSAAAVAEAKARKINPGSIGFWTMPADAAQLEREAHAALDHARALVSQMLAVKGTRTVQNTLAPYREIHRFINLARGSSDLLHDTHPDASMRQASEKIVQEVKDFRSRIELDPHIYSALADLEGRKELKGEASYYWSRTLGGFRKVGVDKPDEIRRQIAELRAEIVKLEQDFGRNIVTGLAWLSLSAAELDGVPQDFLSNRKRDERGNILISNDQAEVTTVVTFARNSETRRRVSSAGRNRGFPANTQVLNRLIDLRRRLANVCGFRTYADMNVQDRMVGSAERERQFLDEVDKATLDEAREQLAMLLEEKRRDQPGASSVDAWDISYYSRRMKERRYDIDMEELRAYFPYARMKEGVLQVASRLYGISFRPVKVPVWHPTVEVYDVLEKGSVIGRIYLDMFPRADKYQHAGTRGPRQGISGYQLPEVALICNMPQPSENNPALMDGRGPATFFHEFGHLLHGVFFGHRSWPQFPVPDFLEAPSQLFEEWVRNPTVLATFARHYKTDKPVPAVLVDRMEKSANFGGALNTRYQLYLANLSLVYESGNGPIDTNGIAREMAPRYALFKLPDDDHLECNFTHLGLPGYAGAYYTYQWSLVIAKDLLTKFNKDDLLDPKIASRYRRLVLEPGGSAPAAKLIENFLGRPFNLKAYQAWLQSY